MNGFFVSFISFVMGAPVFNQHHDHHHHRYRHQKLSWWFSMKSTLSVCGHSSSAIWADGYLCWLAGWFIYLSTVHTYGMGRLNGYLGILNVCVNLSKSNNKFLGWQRHPHALIGPETCPMLDYHKKQRKLPSNNAITNATATAINHQQWRPNELV